MANPEVVTNLTLLIELAIGVIGDTRPPDRYWQQTPNKNVHAILDSTELGMNVLSAHLGITA
jgi:hypothetical protein